MALDGLTLHGLTAELARALVGGRVQQIHHPSPEALVLRVWSSRDQAEHTLYLGFGEPPWCHLTKAKPDNPMTPSSFCMLLRKHLKNGFVDEVVQLDLERIVDLTVRRPEASYVLRAELLGRHGNAVLLDPAPTSGPRVMGAAVQRPSRPLPPGATYAPPLPQDKLDPLNAAPEAWRALARDGQPLWRWALGALHGVGPQLAKALVGRAGLDPERAAETLERTELDALWEKVAELAEVARAERFSPCVWARDGVPVDADAFRWGVRDGLEARPATTLCDAFDACLQVALPTGQDDGERARLLKPLGAQLKKVNAALDRVAADLKRAERFEAVKREADAIMAHLHALAPGQRAELADLETGQPITVQIDPQHTPVEAAQKQYARYKKLKRGVDKLTERQATLRLEREHLETAQTQVEQAESPEELAALAAELGLARPPDPRKPPPAPTGPRRVEVDGYVILVGRNSRQNDELTRRAHSEDWWLHARQRAGSHVVIQSRGNAEGVPQGVRLRAAQLAAYYSKGRNAAKVPVICTRVKHLKKPKGAKPGLVLVSKEEHTLVVAPAKEDAP